MFEKPIYASLMVAGLLLFPFVSVQAGEVGRVGVDWLGNDVVVEAVNDPKVEGVTCYLASFSRGVIDRLQKGNWFENPSNASISCEQSGPIKIGAIKLGKKGERIFSERTSLIWKKLIITRIYDADNDTLLYLTHAAQVQDGSAKTALSTVPLYRGDVVWIEGKP